MRREEGENVLGVWVNWHTCRQACAPQGGDVLEGREEGSGLEETSAVTFRNR